MKKTFSIIFLSILFINCISTARVSDFPLNSNSIDFDKYSKEFTVNKTPFWTLNTSNEYYIEREIHISEDLLVANIEKALKLNNYSITSKSKETRCFIGKRGMKANEWNSITGIYYKLENQNTLAKIYIRTKITQDITGGWRENRAMKVGKDISF